MKLYAEKYDTQTFCERKKPLRANQQHLVVQPTFMMKMKTSGGTLEAFFYWHLVFFFKFFFF